MPFDFSLLCSSFSLSLSLSRSLPFWVEGKTGGRRGSDALVKGRRRNCSPLLQEVTVKQNKNNDKKYCHAMQDFSSALIFVELLKQLEKHGCNSRENLVQLPNR